VSLVESYEDVEGDLVRAIRGLVGPDVVIVGTFDLHGNISARMVANYDFVAPNHLYPHTDSYERGIEAMRMAPRLLDGSVKTTSHLESVPLLLPISMMCTQQGFPAAEINDFMYSLEARPGVLDVTVFHGFPWADISIVGASVVVTTNDDQKLAAAVGREAGQWLWDQRLKFEATISSDGVPRKVLSDVHTANSAIQAALQIIQGGQDSVVDHRPVCINETADNCGGGAPVQLPLAARCFIDIRIVHLI
jgi:microcystin degradation protein MlrC